jgi:hypothetical protein
MTTELLFRFDNQSSKFESSRCATINHLLGTKGEVSNMTTPLSTLSIFFVQPGRFLLLHGRQQSQLLPKFVNLGQFKRCHLDPLPPLGDSDQGGKDQLQATPQIEETKNNFGPSLSPSKESVPEDWSSEPPFDASPDISDDSMKPLDPPKRPSSPKDKAPHTSRTPPGFPSFPSRR